jgi:hypothetical protein
MTLNRRNFLQAGMGIGIGAAGGGLCHSGLAAAGTAPIHNAGVSLSEYERILATTNRFNSLGHPRSWSVVQQGFLPISPERVLRFEPYHGTGNRWTCSAILQPDHIRARLSRDASQSDYHRRAAEEHLSDEKLRLIIKITGELARFYSVPEYWENWAFGMTMRESLMSTCSWRHLAEPQQWQHHLATSATRMIHTANATVDWWLILIPSGTVDWEPFDGEPTHIMFMHVFSRSYPAMPGAELMALELVGRAVRGLLTTSPDGLLELSQMDRVSAARRMNQHVISALREIER